VTFFSIGTLICGVAPTDKIMILGRVVAGAGGGCLNTISVFVASDLIPLRKRGLWQGIGNLVYGAGMGLGTIHAGNLRKTIHLLILFLGGVFGGQSSDFLFSPTLTILQVLSMTSLTGAMRSTFKYLLSSSQVFSAVS
jgi:MFS family permease